MQIKDALGVSNKPVESRDRAKAAERSGGRDSQSSQAGAAGGGDRVEISSRSREAAQAQQVLAATPEVRSEKVASIKNLVENNQYEVDAEKVAHKMIVDVLGELV